VPARPSFNFRSTPPERERVPPGKAVVAALDEEARVRLQHVLVERVTQPAIDAVGAEVVHEVAQHGVREEVLPGAVRGRRKPRALEGKTEHDGVQVGEVRRNEHDGSDLGEPSNVLAWTLNDDATIEPGEVERLGKVLHHGARRHERAEERCHRAGGKLVHARIEVARHVPRVELRVLADRLTQLRFGHAPEGGGEVAPLRKLGSTARSEPTHLEVRRVGQRIEGIFRVVAHTRNDLLHDAASRFVEAKNGGSALAHRQGPTKKALECHVGMTPKVGRANKSDPWIRTRWPSCASKKGQNSHDRDSSSTDPTALAVRRVLGSTNLVTAAGQMSNSSVRAVLELDGPFFPTRMRKRTRCEHE
jgi:hypothetical protein